MERKMGKDDTLKQVTFKADKAWFLRHGETIDFRQGGMAMMLIPLVFMLALAFIVGCGVDFPDIVTYIVGAIMITTMLVFMWRNTRAGTKFWERYKDAQEPIELDPLPKWRLWPKK